MKPARDSFTVSPQPPDADGVTAVLFLKLLLISLIEGGSFLLHYTVYTQTMTLMPGGYLVDIPGIGWLFGGAPDMQVNHLVAAFMALASVATPVLGFYYLLRERVLDDPQAYFAYIPHRIYVGVLAAFWALMIGVEIVNVLTLIQSYIQNPFIKSDVAETFRQHEGLAFLSAVVISIVNAAIGLGTALAWRAILARKEG